MPSPLDRKIAEVLEDPKIYGLIEGRRMEFLGKLNAPLDEKFSELVFCTLTANTSAEMGLRCQEHLHKLGKYDEESLRDELVRLRYRFPNTRSRFIAFNYGKRELLEGILESEERRGMLVDNFYGIGMKEASHFLRNIGYFDYSILDKHIQKFLSKYFGREVKVRSRKDYEREEELFLRISSNYGLSLIHI